MKAVTLVDQFTLGDLHAIAQGEVCKPISDLDFLETLAGHRCLLVPPWVLRLHPDGSMTRLALLSYDLDMNLDKARVLVDVFEALESQPTRHGAPTPVNRMAL